jgi:hypothetical protein
MRHAWIVLLLAAACDDYSTRPCPRLGARQMPGQVLLRGDWPAVDERFPGFLIATDKPGHYSVGWYGEPGATTVYSGTVAVDGTIDPASTLAHTGFENLTFDSPQQISFHSAPGDNLQRIDVTASTDVIYFDAYVDGSHVGVDLDYRDKDGCWLPTPDLPRAFTGGP